MPAGTVWKASGSRHWMLLVSGAVPDPYPTHVDLCNVSKQFILLN